MPPQSGPSLTVQASPVNTYVAAAAPAVALYDQQQVAMAQQLVSAFSDLSVTAARFAGSMKAEQNEEEIKAGMDLVNKSRKSYQKLVESGEIKPTENPWMAVGAQQASGTLEGMRARADFERIYALKASEDPKFFDNPEAFDSLAAQYVQNANVNLGDASYQTRSFYEAFNPYIASKAMQHEEAIAKHREERILIGVQAGVSKALQDSLSPSQAVRDDAMTGLKDLLSTPQGVSLQRVNQAVIATFVDALEESDNPDHVMAVFSEVSAGTGKLIDTQDAKAALGKAKAAIERNRDRLTREESVQFDNWLNNELIPTAFDENLTDEQVRERLDTYFAGPDRKISVTAQEMESKKAYAFGEINKARREFERQREEEIDNTIATRIETASTLDDPDQAMSMVQETLDRLGVPKVKQMQWRNIAESEYAGAARRREAKRLQQEEDWLWNGIGESKGLNQTASEGFATFFTSDTLPPLAQIKDKHDKWKISVGADPGSDKAKALDRNAYSRFEGMIDKQVEAMAQQFGGSLQPTPNDTPQVRAQKALMRGKASMLKMNLGMTFGDTREASKAVTQFFQVSNAATVEVGGMDVWPAEDLLYAYSAAITNGIPISAVLPGGPNGDALKETLDLAVTRLRAGENSDDVLRDIVQMRAFGTTTQIAKAAYTNNPLGYAHINTGRGEDGVDFQNTFMVSLQDMEVTQPDAFPYAASEFQRIYLDTLSKAPHNPKAAVSAAEEAMKNNNIRIRGSIVPKARGFRPEVNEDYLESWLRLNYPKNNDATLVVVAQQPNGEPVFAVRNAEGAAIPPTRGGIGQIRLYSPADINADAMALPLFIETVREARSRRLREPVRMIGRNKQVDTGW